MGNYSSKKQEKQTNTDKSPQMNEPKKDTVINVPEYKNYTERRIIPENELMLSILDQKTTNTNTTISTSTMNAISTVNTDLIPSRFDKNNILKSFNINANTPPEVIDEQLINAISSKKFNCNNESFMFGILPILILTNNTRFIKAIILDNIQPRILSKLLDNYYSKEYVCKVYTSDIPEMYKSKDEITVRQTMFPIDEKARLAEHEAILLQYSSTKRTFLDALLEKYNISEVEFLTRIITLFWDTKKTTRECTIFVSDIVSLEEMKCDYKVKIFIIVLLLANDTEFTECVATIRSCRDTDFFEKLEEYLEQYPSLHNRIMDLLFEDARLVTRHIYGFHFLLLDKENIEKIVDSNIVNMNLDEPGSFASVINKMLNLVNTTTCFKFKEKLSSRIHLFEKRVEEYNDFIRSIMRSTSTSSQNRLEYLPKYD